MEKEQILLFILGIISVIGTVLASFNKMSEEIKKTRDTIGEDYIKAKDLEEIAGHKEAILGIGGILKRMDKQDEKFAHDLDVLTCHDKTLQDHAKMIK